jgi:hypothetical protein
VFQATDFIVGTDNPEDLIVHPKPHSNYYWLYHKLRKRKIQFFVLDNTRKNVIYACQVTLIKKEGHTKFTPRLHFTIREREKPGKPILEKTIKVTRDERKLRNLKASVNLGECHENFWKLISFLKHMADLDVPDERFSLMKKSKEELERAFFQLDPGVAKSLVKGMAQGIALTEQDLNEMFHRKQKLQEFEKALGGNETESYWRQFFYENKWIFGYGLNYVILDSSGQAYAGGKKYDGTGGQNPDHIAVTRGNVKFTVVVEIKTAATPLVSDKEVRNGAWSLSEELADAIVQIQANTDTWNTEGARTKGNQRELESEQGVYTVTPRGIVVIGCLRSLEPPDKIETFERFRRSFKNPEIITYDELYERAKYIVEHA